MNKIVWWKNRSISYAIIAGLAAAIAVYGLISSTASTRINEGYKMSDKKDKTLARKQSEPKRTTPLGDRVYAALTVDDYETLKTHLRKGARINIIYSGISKRSETNETATILRDVLVAEVPKSSQKTSTRAQGILIDISIEESERLAAYSEDGQLEIVVSK